MTCSECEEDLIEGEVHICNCSFSSSNRPDITSTTHTNLPSQLGRIEAQMFDSATRQMRIESMLKQVVSWQDNIEKQLHTLLDELESRGEGE